MFSYSPGYYVSPPDDQYLKFKNRCSLLARQSCRVACLLICASGANNFEKASGLFQILQSIQTVWGNVFSYKKTRESIIISGESFSFTYSFLTLTSIKIFYTLTLLLYLSGQRVNMGKE
jgi:hypothetical protein